MGAFSTGLMLLGIAFLYGASQNGSFFVEEIAAGKAPLSPLFISGLLLLLVSMSFKVSAAPFHFWTPDVYDGAPTVFTSFMATIVKAAIFIAFIHLFDSSFGGILKPQWHLFVAIITAATLFIGNLTAVFQQSVKRMLAYSSIAQAGFMLLGILALNDMAKQGILLYAAAYSLATIGIFAILIKMKDYTLEGFNGLARRHPLLAATCTVFLLSLAGIPLTAGFFREVLYAGRRDPDREVLLAGDIRGVERRGQRLLLFPDHPGDVFQGGGSGAGSHTGIQGTVGSRRGGDRAAGDLSGLAGG